MCKEQTSVSHSSTESEVLSLDAGLRMDGLPALDLWDLDIEVLHSSLNQPSIQGNRCRDEQSGKRSNTRTKKRPNWDDLRLNKFDHVTSTAQLSHLGALLTLLKTTQKSENQTCVPHPKSRA